MSIQITRSYKYTLTTPFRVNAGLAFQIKKRAIISADYEFVDYSTSRFSNAIDNQGYFVLKTNNIQELFDRIKPAT